MSEPIQKGVDAFFTSPVVRSAQDSVFAALPGDAPPPAGRAFSVFVAEDMEAAIAVADRMARAAAEALARDGSDNDAVAAAFALATDLRGNYPEGLVDHAAKLFLTHDHAARNVRIPNLMSRMTVNLTSPLAGGTGTLPALGGTTGSADEDKINWFREDPLANEHHEHWHLVYVRFDSPGFSIRPRHGELFFYMHQQMLARYDAERLGAGLDPVEPFDDYDASIGVGYDPGGLAIGGVTYLSRPANGKWAQLALINNYAPADHAQRRDRLRDAAATLKLAVPGGASLVLDGAPGSDALGHADESSGKSISGAGYNSFYGNHHGFGHVFTAALSDQATYEGGVMYNPAAAIRDPFFWRWHRHVDDINFAYQEKLPANDFAAAPDVAFGGGDDAGLIILDSALFRNAAAGLGATVDQLAEGLFGGQRFNQNAAQGTIGQINGQPLQVTMHDTIETELRHGIFQLNTDQQVEEQPRFTYPYLWHPSYHFAVRLRSTAAAEQLVTVRLFLCPAFAVDGVADGSLNNRRLWIELDKFAAPIAPGEEKVLARADTDSTLVRRPVTALHANPDVVRDLHFDQQGDDHPDAAACECGWPYHLLYPRGTKSGMRFALLAVVTKDDALIKQGQCGSMSFCAVTDEYPDAKPMGYPFDRPLAVPLADLVAQNPSLALRFITIKER
ncbi:hypothetical protein [Sphingomonas sp.]|uniref:hypothetical protein n=1 Tax=Sphingomonas sp. TaxID=28214 RepID=UPI003D6D4A69